MKKKHIFSLALLLLPGFAWADDITVNSAEDWQTMCTNAETYASGTITLGADIDVTTPFPAAFTGTLDGQGHTVTYYLTNPDKFALILSTGEGALIKNLKITGTFESTNPAAGVAYTVNGPTTIQNVKVSVNITSSGYPLSGFVVEGKSKMTITDCEYSGTLWCYAGKSADCAGFISSLTEKGAFTISNSCFSGTVKEETKTGAAGSWRASGFVSTVEKIAEADECFFNNCSYTGTILQGNGSVRLGGYVGSANAGNIGYHFKNCLMAGSVEHWKSNSDPTYATDANNIVVGSTSKAGKFYSENCYIAPSLCKIGSYTNNPAFTPVTADQIASGALCYSLNGDQTEINFYQALGGDAVPVLDSTHKQVFADGHKHCNGDDYEGVTYNNEAGSTQVDEHNFVDGVCDYCKQLQFDEEGFFHVVSQKGWEAAAEQINSGNTSLNIKLETDVEQHSTLASGFFGILDGQGHSIDVTMGSEDKTDTNVGSGKVSLFGTIGGATIRNIVFTGKLIGSCATAPIASYASAYILVENVVSLVQVVQTTTTDGNCSGFIGLANANTHFRNCIFAGNVQATKDAGGFLGWSAGYTHTIENCIMIGEVTKNQGASSVFFRIKDNNTVHISNCFYAPCSPTIINGNGKEIAANAQQIDPSQIASGALCYLVNSDGDTHFYQTLGTDEYPVPFAFGHAQVFANGRKHCNGDTYEDLTYNNTKSSFDYDNHTFGEDGVCSVCGMGLVDGTYQISKAAHMQWFADFVNKGNVAANAVLTADIDMTGVRNFPGIGNSEWSPSASSRTTTYLYAGTFDGQGHKISNLAIVEPESQDVGLFDIAKATLKNFWLDESCLIYGKQNVGLVAWCNGDSPLLENVGNAAQIKGGENTSAFIGRAWKNVKFKNCWSVGEIDNSVGGGNQKNNGVFIGWCSNWGATLTNCWTTSTYKIAPADGNYLTRKNDNCTFNNTYAIAGDQGKRITAEDVTSGALCYALNKGAGETVYYQTIGTDQYPVFDKTHGIMVHIGATGYATFCPCTSNVIIPEGVKAYGAKLKTNYVTLNPFVGNVIGVYAGVVLQGAEGYYSFIPTDQETELIENDLYGTFKPIDATGTKYVLAEKDGVVGFYQAEQGTYIPAGKAYLEYFGTEVKGFFFGDTDGIDLTPALSQGEGASAIFDLSGRRVEKATKGIYIINGKKVLR